MFHYVFIYPIRSSIFDLHIFIFMLINCIHFFQKYLNKNLELFLKKSRKTRQISYFFFWMKTHLLQNIHLGLASLVCQKNLLGHYCTCNRQEMLICDPPNFNHRDHCYCHHATNIKAFQRKKGKFNKKRNNTDYRNINFKYYYSFAYGYWIYLFVPSKHFLGHVTDRLLLSTMRFFVTSV